VPTFAIPNSKMDKQYDVIIVGAGHAGCEAACAAANLGSRVLLITMNMGTIGQMSCNPAMGGVAKGQIVREIDALGGQSGIISDRSMVQFRMLNRSKGPAMWSPRTQNDRSMFASLWRKTLEDTPNIDFWQDMVTGITTEKDKVTGVKTGLGGEIKGRTVVLTSGTFMNGIMHIGEKQFGGGRAGEHASVGITEDLVKLGFEAGRMKTGTPPRVDGRSIDYSVLEEQFGDETITGFSYLPSVPKPNQQLSCHITYTNAEVHDLLREGFDKSPMFNGRIQGVGPRYCPSIEDKIERFADKDRHQIFIEPEGWNTVETYINGFSTSLPEDIQKRALRSVPGMANAKLFRPGYAVEYDYFPPTQLTHTLETKTISGLFFAGQINGTTGYEEAACQGLMAGINAHLKNKDKAPFLLERNTAYIGVLIDDLITKGTEEPYRMFTSRAEFRILLRQDNADLRLTELGHKLGLASNERLARVHAKQRQTTTLSKLIRNEGIAPSSADPVIVPRGTSPLKQQVKAYELLLRPQLDFAAIEQMSPKIKAEASAYGDLRSEVVEQVEINAKYDRYITKQLEQAERLTRMEDYPIGDLDFSKLGALSNEAREKLATLQPRTIGQATRISGISPADISVLLVYLGR